MNQLLVLLQLGGGQNTLKITFVKGKSNVIVKTQPDPSVKLLCNTEALGYTPPVEDVGGDAREQPGQPSDPLRLIRTS